LRAALLDTRRTDTLPDPAVLRALMREFLKT
jgi:hypothetical protein